MTDQQLIRAAIGDRDGFGYILPGTGIGYLETHPRTPFPSGWTFVQALLAGPPLGTPFCIQNGTIYIFRRKPTS